MPAHGTGEGKDDGATEPHTHLHRIAPGQQTHVLEEPDALVAHVRIRGSPGPVTTRGHPTPSLLWLFVDGAPVTSRAYSGDVAIGADATLLVGSRLNPGAGVAPSLITAVSLRGRPATFQQMARAYARSAPINDGGPR